MLNRYLFTPLAALALLAAPRLAHAQTGSVGIGITIPDASAALDIVSTSKGLLLPRVAAAAALASPAPGLLVYQTGSPAGFYYNAGTAATPSWQQLGTTTNGDNLGNHTATRNLNLGTNQLVGDGGSTGLTITNGGNVGIGTTTAPIRRLDVNGSGLVRGPLRVGTNVAAGALEVVGAGGVVTGLDQQQQQSNGSGGGGSSDQWQSFTAGLTGSLARLELRIGSPIPPAVGSGTLSVYAGEGTGGALLTSQAVTYQPVANTYQAYVLTTPVPVVMGEKYTYRLTAAAITTGWIGENGNDPYAGGRASIGPTVDLLFRTYVTGAQPTPLFTVLAGGNVGIGTSSPTQPLEVAGPVYSSAGGFRFPDNTVQTTAALGSSDVILNQTSTQSGASFHIGGSGAIDGNATVAGRVGIGTTSAPSQKLEVAGQVFSNTGGFRFPDNSVQTTAGLAVGSAILNQATLQSGASFNIAGNGYVAGSVGIGTTAPGHPLVVQATASGGRLLGFNNASGADKYNFSLDPNGLVLSESNVAARLFVQNGTGNVGIGTTNPGQKLDVAGNASVSGSTYVGGSLALRSGTTEKYNWSLTNGGLNLSESNVASGRLFVQDGGNIGIGTTSPSARLEVQGVGNVGTNSFAFFRRFNNAANSGFVTGQPNDVSIYASGPVMAAEFYATSDRRLKTVVGRSDNAADLALLNQLRITDYTMRDWVVFGKRQFKKVIAQEVEAVLPQAVTRQTGFLPDVYALATTVQALPGDSLLVLTLPAGLPSAATAGQRLKLLGEAGPVLAIVARPAAAAARTITVRRAQALAGAAVFVYGLEHADVRAVDYEALSMLNVSATQELARKVAALEARAATAEANAATAETRAAQATATLETFEARLRRLEAAGGSDLGGQARK